MARAAASIGGDISAAFESGAISTGGAPGGAPSRGAELEEYEGGLYVDEGYFFEDIEGDEDSYGEIET